LHEQDKFGKLSLPFARQLEYLSVRCRFQVLRTLPVTRLFQNQLSAALPGAEAVEERRNEISQASLACCIVSVVRYGDHRQPYTSGEERSSRPAFREPSINCPARHLYFERLTASRSGFGRHAAA
jgi:hypothetical protein